MGMLDDLNNLLSDDLLVPGLPDTTRLRFGHDNFGGPDGLAWVETAHCRMARHLPARAGRELLNVAICACSGCDPALRGSEIARVRAVDALMQALRPPINRHRLEEIIDLRTLADPSFWAYQRPTGHPLSSWVAGVCDSMYVHTIASHLRVGMEAVMQELRQIHGTPVRAKRPGRTALWLFQPDRFHSETFEPVASSLSGLRSDVDRINGRQQRLRASYRATPGHRLTGANVALIHTRDAVLFGGHVTVAPELGDDVDTLNQLWQLASTAATPVQAQRLISGFRAATLT